MSNVVIDPFGAFAGGAPPASGFPTIESTVTFVENVAGASHDVTLPTGLTTGKLALLLIRTGRNPSEWYVPSGWTQVLASGSAGNLLVAYRVCDGTEGATVALSAHDGLDVSVNTRAVAITYRIGGAAVTEATVVAGEIALSTDSAPLLTPSWGSADTLWLALYTARRADWEVTALPSGYASAGAQMHTASLTSDVTTGIVAGQRDAAAASETPGAFTVTDSPTGLLHERAVTLAVRPAT